MFVLFKNFCIFVKKKQNMELEKIELTKNLILNYIETNNIDDDKLITVYLSFNFYGQHCGAYLLTKNLDEEWGSFAMTETSSDLLESFNDKIEDPEIFSKIKEQVKLFIKDFEEEWVD